MPGKQLLRKRSAHRLFQSTPIALEEPLGVLSPERVANAPPHHEAMLLVERDEVRVECAVVKTVQCDAVRCVESVRFVGRPRHDVARVDESRMRDPRERALTVEVRAHDSAEVLSTETNASLRRRLRATAFGGRSA